ncbi:unnamed protein product [Nippostrongylus brasiliensis]|uniref:Uncharacterized protein n=1 Tax=Nippostrongylus brasiliensis TaxID=27835 RepID=A0A0N4YZF0_NIPBR|nr:unnamed protein product [Nippostrongylus brasiliensis]
MTTSLTDKKNASERSCDPLCELNKPFHMVLVGSKIRFILGHRALC